MTLNGVESTMRPRMQLLRVPAGTRLIPVVRIESRSVSQAPIKEIARGIIQLSEQPGVWALQIDFDARLSERPFYRGLLAELRNRLPPDIKVEITALVSWCCLIVGMVKAGTAFLRAWKSRHEIAAQTARQGGSDHPRTRRNACATRGRTG